MKNFFKDFIILLLLAFAIILILGILLYNYLPTNVSIPEEVSYSTPSSVEEELSSSSSSDDPLTVPYSVTASDLTNYKRTQEYVPGKKNPFAAAPTQNGTNSTDGNNTTSSSNSTTSDNSNSSDINSNANTNDQNTNTSTSTNTNEGYLPNRGTK